MTKLRKLVAVVGVCIGVSSAWAQDDLANPLEPAKAPSRIFIGPVVGFNRVSQTGGFQYYANPTDAPLCPVLEDGNANGFFVGINTEIILGNPKDSRSSLIFRLLYNRMPSSFEQLNDRLPTRIVDANGNSQTIITTTSFTANVTYTTIDFEGMYRFGLGTTGFGIQAGPVISYAIERNVEQLFKLIEPDNAQFVQNTNYQYRDNFRTAVIFDGQIPESNALRIGLKAGIQYEIFLRRMTIVPSLNYNFGITNLTRNESWRVNTIQAQVDVRFAF
ncbi:MAG: outer membrane beta-barrel protein [Chlorobi bacterium]|nr:outer membrane beta-barrel protein [Chlorobiota bacterium]